VNPGRDFTADTVADLRVVTPEDRCPKCQGQLEFVRAIESGHVFKLGTKYSQALGAVFQEPGGPQKPMIMGCYGIGVNRILAAAIEQHHDANGIVWPAALAPFAVVVTVMEADSPDHLALGERLEQELAAAGLDTLLDDRVQSPGSKLKDADLVGIPVQVVVGKVWEAEQHLEVVLRPTKDKLRVKPELLVDTVRKQLDKMAAAQ
jgi:prolyl-tRNA synthetase